MAALKYWVWLATLPGLGTRTRLQLLEHFDSPEDIYYADEGELLLTPDITKAQAALLADKSLERTEQVLADCARDGQFILTMGDSLYPNRLRTIFDPPILLYGKGALPMFDDEVAVTVVGTRSCTPYGVRAASQLGYELSKQGALLVSGMAKGIDGEALKGALRAGGFTAAVLGGGADVIYPAENRRLYHDIAATGVILSEYPPGTVPKADHFPVRNRLLSALSLATVVVEAPEKSGALITATTALEQGREVFAVPGPFDAPMSRGTNALIREGAGLVCEAWDVLSFYESRYPHKLRPLRAKLPPLPKGSTPPEDEGPITCRLYGVPTAIAGQGHVCGFAAFEKGKSYPTVYLDKIQSRLEDLSREIGRTVNSRFRELHEVYVPLSMALITNYDEAYLGIGPAKPEK